MNKLATLERVKLKGEIPEASKLERLIFNDSIFVCRKDEFTIGDIVLVVKSGAVLPKTLSRKCGKIRFKGDRMIYPLKLRNTISDCVIFDLSAVTELLGDRHRFVLNPEHYLGEDISLILGIKRAANIKVPGKPKTSFEKFIQTIKNKCSVI